MKGKTTNRTTSCLGFLGSLFVVLLLLPRVSVANTPAPDTGQDNSWIAKSTSCPGWGETAEMAPSSTIREYSFNPSNQLQPNSWGFQVNAATSASLNGYDFYQIGPATTSTTTSVGVQIGDNVGKAWYIPGTVQSYGYYMGTAGGRVYTTMVLTGANAVGALWSVYNPSGQLILSTGTTWPATYNGYSLQNPVQNYQGDFTGPAYVGGGTYGDFYSGAGQLTYTGSSSGYYQSIWPNGNCNFIMTAENSNVVYSSPNCGSAQCTQNFNAVSGYEGHNTCSSSCGSNFQVTFGTGWGETTVGVHAGDLLIALEATYSGGVTFNTPKDTLLDTWTLDGNGVYCSNYDCVAIWHAVAKTSGADAVTFYTSASSTTTYGFVREFVGYSGTVWSYGEASGTSGAPSLNYQLVPPCCASDLIIGVAAETVSGWQPGQYYFMIGGNTGWSAATEFGPGWANGNTYVPWAAPSGGNWAELAIDYVHP